MSPAFPELLLSLTIQSTLVLLVTFWLARRASRSDLADLLWSRSHVCILLLSLAGLTLPHLRLVQADRAVDLLTTVAASHGFERFAAVVSGIWLFGVLLLSVSTLWSLWKTTRLVKHSAEFRVCRSAEESGGTLDHISPETAERLKRLGVRVLRSENCVTPFCWQLHRPVIVLPETLIAFPREELDAVLRHELAHLEAKHPLRLFLQRLVEIGFWFNPLVWSASREASVQRELASDASANESAMQAADFLKSMVRLSESCTLRTHRLVAGLGFGGAGESMIKRRAAHLLSLNWTDPAPRTHERGETIMFVTAAVLVSLIWIPLNALATDRAIFSPWPRVTASVLREMGMTVRDYEIDNHRLLERVERDGHEAVH
jgi:bla regulator protein blaR1